MKIVTGTRFCRILEKHGCLDVHVPAEICDQLRLRGADVLTMQADKLRKLTDEELLCRAAALGRVLFALSTDIP